MSSDQIEGRNPVREALRSGRTIRRLLVAEGTTGDAIAQILGAARKAGVRVERVPRKTMDRMAASRAHQGVIAEAEEYRYRSWREALAIAEERKEPPLLVALDGITDPGNVGSLCRSAEAAGAHGVILSGRRSASVTPVVEKTAAGALSHLVVDRVPSLANAVVELRERGVWSVGLAATAVLPLWACDLLVEPLVLIVGAEGKGLSRLVSERADALVAIPLGGSVGSLNAAVAGAVALFETVRRRHVERTSGRA